MAGRWFWLAEARIRLRRSTTEVAEAWLCLHPTQEPP